MDNFLIPLFSLVLSDDENGHHCHSQIPTFLPLHIPISWDIRTHYRSFAVLSQPGDFQFALCLRNDSADDYYVGLRATEESPARIRFSDEAPTNLGHRHHRQRIRRASRETRQIETSLDCSLNLISSHGS